MWFYSSAASHEYLAITGAYIENIKLCRKAFVWPAQRCMKFSIQPRDYSLNLRAMTKEKLQFELPVVFTIGPDVNREQGPNTPTQDASLLKYVMLLADGDHDPKNRGHIDNIVKGIIEGETRVLVSSMTMEEIFTEREQFKKRIYHNIQDELNQFGLKIYNANVKELTDPPESNYFATLSRKAHEGASNQARVDVAEAQMKGNVGEADRQGKQNREIAKIHADTAVQKTERDTEKAQAEATLATRKAAFDRDVNIAQIEATRATETRDEELLKEVEIKRAQREVERLRASDVVKATILRESQQQAADAKAYEMEAAAKAEFFREQKMVDANTYKTKMQAEASYLATAKDAEAAFLRKAKEAEAQLIKETKEAEGLLIRQSKEAEALSQKADAYAKMSQAFGGPQGLIQYMMIEKGIYGELARANAEAVHGMQPKITVWNTGSGSASEGGSNNDPTAAIRNTYQMLPPLMSTINDQTGITLPEWQFGKLAGAISDKEAHGITNGSGMGN